MVDDALQTAALRALCRAEGFDSLDGLVKWAIAVAWHEVQDEWRRQARVAPGEIPEHPDRTDTPTVVEYRLVLDAAAAGLASLTRAERDAILAASTAEIDDAERSRVKMRRYRARQRLALQAGWDGRTAQ